MGNLKNTMKASNDALTAAGIANTVPTSLGNPNLKQLRPKPTKKKQVQPDREMQ